MFSPIAKGINPKIVVIAVNKTGLKRALPAFTILSKRSSFVRYSSSSKSSSFFFLSIRIVHNLKVPHHYLLQFRQVK